MKILVLAAVIIFAVLMVLVNMHIIPLIPISEWAALVKVGVWLVSIIIGWRIAISIASVVTLLSR